jgi:hypothetical protein
MASLPSIKELRELKVKERIPHLKDALFSAIIRTLKQDPASSQLESTSGQFVTGSPYIELLWPSMDKMSIDCEYNRDVARYKEYDFEVTRRKKGFRNDIILHERLSGNYNMLAVEAKSQSSRKKREDDKRKIVRVVTQVPYRYNLGAFLNFRNGPRVNEPGVIAEFFTEAENWSEPQSMYSEFNDDLAALAASRKS